jgi:hypothetical protein
MKVPNAECSPYGIIPKGTDGVSCGNNSYAQAYSLDLLSRNAQDLADWLLDNNLDIEQHRNIINMLNSNDEESKVLALELLKIKKEEHNGNSIHISGS